MPGSKPSERRGGRQKGTPNKATEARKADLHQALALAFAKFGPEFIDTLTPARLQLIATMLLLASSPYRRTGSLWDSYQRHYGRDDARVLVWQAKTAAMNPSIDERIIAEAYEDDPESAASEYGAQFRSDIADFVSRAVVEACIERGVHERPPARAAGQVYSKRRRSCWRICAARSRAIIFLRSRNFWTN